MDDQFRSTPSGRFREQHHEALAWLASVEDSRLSQVVAALNSFSTATRDFSRTQLIEWVSMEGAKDDAISPIQTQDLVDALIDLAIMSRVTQAPQVALAGAVADEMARLHELDAPILAARLQQLLREQSIFGLAAQEDLIAENDRVFTGCRILTDVRPVFEDDAEGQPVRKGEIVLHILRISYWQEGSERSFTVTLRDRDLGELAQWVARETKKGQSLSADNLSHRRAQQN